MADAILAASGIYAIRNTINGKQYIGSAVSIKKRWITHKSALSLNKHHSKKLQNAWNKYGADVFVFDVLEIVSDTKMLISAEQSWIDRSMAFEYGYNCKKIANSFLGMKQPETVLKKMSAAMMGNSYGTGSKRTPEQLKRMAEVSTGRKMSDATKAKIAEARKDFSHSIEAKNKISESLIGNTRTLGYKQSAETKQKVSESLKGNKRALGMVHSPEAREKMSKASKGRPVSDATRAKRSAAMKGRVFSAETLEKMRVSARLRVAKKLIALDANC